MPPKSTTLIELRNDLRLHLVSEMQMAGDAAHAVALAVADYLRTRFGGGDLYIPKEDTLDARDVEMWEAFDGTNYDDVGRKFGLTGRQARNRIALVREVMTKKNQPGLFEAP